MCMWLGLCAYMSIHRVNWMRHLGEDSSQSSSTDEAAKVYTAPWLRRMGLGDGCSMMMHDAIMWNDGFGLVGFCLVRSFCLSCFALFTSLPTTYLASHESRLRLWVPGHHYTCAQAYDLHVFAFVVCVCGIKLYFILPLSLNFCIIYVTLISYYHISTEYIILEFKISSTKILNLDAPPTHQTQHKGTETQTTPKAGQLWDRNANYIQTLFRSIAIHF